MKSPPQQSETHSRRHESFALDSIQEIVAKQMTMNCVPTTSTANHQGYRVSIEAIRRNVINQRARDIFFGRDKTGKNEFFSLSSI